MNWCFDMDGIVEIVRWHFSDLQGRQIVTTHL